MCFAYVFVVYFFYNYLFYIVLYLWLKAGYCRNIGVYDDFFILKIFL